MIKLKSLLIENKLDSVELEKWFGDSKVIDNNGKPLIVYHGTNMKFDRFDKNKIGSSTRIIVNGFFFTDSKKVASKFGTKVISVYLSIKNPTVIDADGRNIRSVIGAYEEGIAKDNGSDGFIIKNVIDTLGFVVSIGNYSSESQCNLFIVFEPDQIKIV